MLRKQRFLTTRVSVEWSNNRSFIIHHSSFVISCAHYNPMPGCCVLGIDSILMRRALLFIIAVILFRCDDDHDVVSNACTLEDPMDAEWLQELKNSLTNCVCETSIIQGKYLDETVFYTMITDPVCSSVFAPTLYDCSGTIVKKFSVYDKDHGDVNKIVAEEVLYRCND